MKFINYALTAAMTVAALPAFAAVINVGTGKQDFIANQEMAYPRTAQAQVQTVQTTTTYSAIAPAAGDDTTAMPKGNDMMPVNSTAKPAMDNADADSNPLPAVK